ncbi:hypothetical protein D3C78_1637580 [compost metagenome]
MQVPLDPHQEQVLHRVLVLVGVQDVGVVGQQEIGDGRHQPLAVGAADQQGGRVLVAHGVLFVIGFRKTNATVGRQTVASKRMRSAIRR